MDTVVVADGFSCRTQIHQLDSGGREAVHVAEVVRAALQGDAVPAGQPPEQAYAARPREPSVAARLAAVAGPVAAVGAARFALVRRHRSPR